MRRHGPEADESMLVAEDVRFRYRGTSREIGPLTLSAGPGLHRLDGVNGAGKSTLLRCLCGDLEPLAGRVRVGGRDPVHDVGARALVGLAPYPDDLPPFRTVGQCWRDLAAFRRRPRWDGRELAERLALPPDLPLAQASAGQRRKAGLLCALVGDPPVLLLDEPWAALDAAAVEIVTALLESLRNSRTVLFTAHGDCPARPDSTHALARPGV